MQEVHLAIASVPIQQWGPLIQDQEALQTGTIFKDLNKPFFAADTDIAKREDAQQKSEEQIERETMLQKIDEVSFVLDDLTLYLDTHENDRGGLKLFREKSEQRDQLKKEFAEKFYPLTRDCLVYGRKESSLLKADSFSWQSGPAPWEGACV